jgi:hypothetical protein
MTRALPALLLAIASAGCSDATDTTTSPTTVDTTALTTEIFTGTLPVGGLRFYSFTVPRDSAYSVLLASLGTSQSPALPDLAVGLGIGTPAGTSCRVTEAVVTTPALARQIDSWTTDGIHCVAIYDVGNLREPVSFAIRFTHY